MNIHPELFEDTLIVLRARRQKQWWNVYFMTDLSVRILHECTDYMSHVNPLGECIKCGVALNFEESVTGALEFDYMTSSEINFDNLYKCSNSTHPGMKGKDYIADWSSISTVDGITYKYIQYSAGFSIILHGKTRKTSSQISALFLNNEEHNLVETKKGKCKICEGECQGAEMKQFLILQSKLGEGKK